MKDFLWGSTSEKRKYHLVNWRTVCKTKEEGGLNIRDVETMGRALRAKWIWRYGNEQGSLWRSIIDSKYGQAINQWWPQPVRLSHGYGLWKGALHDYEFFKSNIQIKVGDGERTLFWKDVWKGQSSLQAQFPLIYTVSMIKGGKISEVRRMNEEVVTWNLQLRRNLYDWEVGQYEQLMAILEGEKVEEGEDKWRWKLDKRGLFSVRSMYTALKDIAMQQSSSVHHPFPFKLVWNRSLPLKICFFLWKVMHKRILTADNLIQRGSVISPICCMCDAANESIGHLFLHCSFALKVWKVMTTPFPDVYLHLFAVDDVQVWLKDWRQKQDQVWGKRIWSLLPIATMWILWKTRNAKIFRGKEINLERTCNEIKATIWFWCGNWAERKKFKFADLVTKWERVLLGLIDPG